MRDTLRAHESSHPSPAMRDKYYAKLSRHAGLVNICTMPTLPRHAGFFYFSHHRGIITNFPAMRDNSFEQTYLPGLAHVQSSNSEINLNILLTHMFNSMLVKLNMYMTFTTLKSETENKIFLHIEYIKDISQ